MPDQSREGGKGTEEMVRSSKFEMMEDDNGGQGLGHR